MSDEPKPTIAVIHSESCPACREYLPRFKREAVRFRPFLHFVFLKAEDPRAQDLLDKHKIKYLPTTVVQMPDGKIRKYKEPLGSIQLFTVLNNAAKGII